jgi:hypothetical protein
MVIDGRMVKTLCQGRLTKGGRLRTVDLHFKVSYFVDGEIIPVYSK